MKRIFFPVGTFLIGAATGIAARTGIIVRKDFRKVKEEQKKADKYLALYLMMNQWVKVKQDGKNLSEYFRKSGYKEIAVYGMSYVGETLVRELKGSETKVVYGIDKNANPFCTDVHVFSPDAELEKVDAVVVTAITFFNQVEDAINLKLGCPVISLEEILYELEAD